MARRLRVEASQASVMSTEERSPSSDSQNESPEAETREGKQSETHEFTEYTAPPPKKKRTRTLTTPHQAAVLHALLAKSRFPNTAVREEVGRSIGLSARKVQIWFQNQRQKARRPRSQIDTASQKRSPQYGAFPSGPDGPIVGSFPFVPEQSSSSRTTLESYMSRSSDHFADAAGSTSHHHRSPEPHSDAMDSSSQLLGPGMPGSELSPELPYHGLPAIPLRPSTAYESSTRYHDPQHQPFRLPTPPRMQLPLVISRPTTANRPHDRDFSRTLPPLMFPPPSTRSSFPASSPSSGPLIATYMDRRSLSPETRFVHQPPQPISAPPIALSPPYVLEPRPHWDTSFGSALRSSDAPSWALRDRRSVGANITPPGSAAPISNAPTTTEEMNTITEPRPPGRYDPVRATYIPSSPKDEN
ncbi:hypothetical protein H0H87_009727 [Tephrocybe sp. NHM501043]|nr:hypothetical protein H0H87_009727 [Tephrocybe sp. NHM501043]